VNLSGLGTATYTTNTLALGSHNVTATYNGNGTYMSSVNSPAFTQLIKLASSTVVTSNRAPSTVALPATFTARVTPTAAPAAGTTVQWTIDTVNVGGPVALTAGVATLTPTLSVGTHTIVATFSGSTTYAISFGTRIQIVN
jgi:hypothetical protein